MSVRVFAPAKINLTLEVGRPRDDGMHPLQSAVVFADVGDWVEVAPAEALSLNVTGPFAAALATEADNLVLRAARALAPGRGAALTLEKNLPIASGIGGGSSDAAAALKALNALWGLGLSEGELIAVAARLGADVAVCVPARSAWITGLGERIASLSAPSLHAVLVNPLRPLPTASVYQEFDRRQFGGGFAARGAPRWSSAEDAVEAAVAIGNDLAAPARALMPEIAVVEAALAHDNNVMHVAVSGSGATCYALVGDADAAGSLAATLQERHPEWWVRAALLSPP